MDGDKMMLTDEWMQSLDQYIQLNFIEQNRYDAEMGEVYEFSVYHLLKIDNPTDVFPIEYIEFNKQS